MRLLTYWPLLLAAWTPSPSIADDGGRIAAGLAEVAALRDRGERDEADARPAELKAWAERPPRAERSGLVAAGPRAERPPVRRGLGGRDRDVERAAELALGAARLVEGPSCSLPPRRPAPRPDAAERGGDPAVPRPVPRGDRRRRAGRRDGGGRPRPQRRGARRGAGCSLTRLIDESGEPIERAAAELVAVASRRLPIEHPTANDVQRFIDRYVWTPMADRAAAAAASDGAEAAEERPPRGARRRSARPWSTPGRHPAGSAGETCRLLDFQWAHQRMAEVGRTLERLEAVAAAAGDAAPRLFLIRERLARGLIDAERGDLATARDRLGQAVALAERHGYPAGAGVCPEPAGPPAAQARRLRRRPRPAPRGQGTLRPLRGPRRRIPTACTS